MSLSLLKSNRWLKSIMGIERLGEMEVAFIELFCSEHLKLF
jgi:hypothetical protein